MTAQVRLRTADDEATQVCTAHGLAEHDFRPRQYVHYSEERTSWVCVWCDGVACGDYGSHDPCIEIYHHRTDHRTRSGLTWKIGDIRPGVIVMEVQ